MGDTNLNLVYPYLDLERKSDPEGEFITLAVRMKLDLSDCRISLEDWKALTEATRWRLHNVVAESSDDVENFRALLSRVVVEASRSEPRRLLPSINSKIAVWKDLGPMPDEVITAMGRISQELFEWNGVSQFSRYILWSFATKKQGRFFEQAFLDLYACGQLTSIKKYRQAH